MGLGFYAAATVVLGDIYNRWNKVALKTEKHYSFMRNDTRFQVSNVTHELVQLLLCGDYNTRL